MQFIYTILFIFLLDTGYSQDCGGDANTDSIINILDVIMVIDHVLDNELLSGQSYNNADVNGNDTVDILDIILIVDLILYGEFECDEPETLLDLSLDWQIQEDLSYLDEDALNAAIDELSAQSNLYGLIVIHNGKIVGEHYQGGGGVNIDFNIFSVTKSFISTLIGQAIGQGYLPSPSTTLNNILTGSFMSSYLEDITLYNLLTMSTGYLDQYTYPYWVNVTTEYLTAMGYTQPGYFFYNNSACHLNSHIIYEATGQTPKEFAGENLFPYLGIENPDWLYGYNGINDGSASLELTLREMVKLGQLYIQGGFSGDIQILSSEYIEEATSFKIDTGFGYGYGFLFWIPYSENVSFEAKGYGGQNIFVYPDRNLVIGTHSYFNSSGSYQNILNSTINTSIAPLFDERN